MENKEDLVRDLISTIVLAIEDSGLTVLEIMGLLVFLKAIYTRETMEQMLSQAEALEGVDTKD